VGRQEVVRLVARERPSLEDDRQGRPVVDEKGGQEKEGELFARGEGGDLSGQRLRPPARLASAGPSSTP